MRGFVYKFEGNTRYEVSVVHFKVLDNAQRLASGPTLSITRLWTLIPSCGLPIEGLIPSKSSQVLEKAGGGGFLRRFV